MKKIIKIAIPLIIIIGGISAFLVHRHKVKMANEQLLLEVSYKHQNKAFGMCQDNFDDRLYFHGSDEIDKGYILIATIVYSGDQDKYELTEQDVVTYLSSEYDESGQLRVYNRPAAIDDYIEWYYHGGAKKVDDYRWEISDFLRENDHTKRITDISYDELVKLVQQYQAENGPYSPEEDDNSGIPKGDFTEQELYEISQEIVKKYGNDATHEEIEEVVNRYKEEKQKSVSN